MVLNGSKIKGLFSLRFKGFSSGNGWFHHPDCLFQSLRRRRSSSSCSRSIRTGPFLLCSVCRPDQCRWAAGPDSVPYCPKLWTFVLWVWSVCWTQVSLQDPVEHMLSVFGCRWSGTDRCRQRSSWSGVWRHSQHIHSYRWEHILLSYLKNGTRTGSKPVSFTASDPAASADYSQQVYQETRWVPWFI